MNTVSTVTMMLMHTAIIIGVVYRIIRGEQTHSITKRTDKFIRNGYK